MLSILIPIYNFDVRKLVSNLYQQAQNLQIVFEIVLVDDASTSNDKLLNQELGTTFPNVKYIELCKNIGRARIRNYLTTLAEYKYLLFMDCDSMPISQNFLSNYVNKLAPNKLLYGGRVYCADKPMDYKRILHWSYGVEREVVDAEARSRHPYQSFMTNNFLIPRSIAIEHPFELSIEQYGHEDTLFGIELKNGGVQIEHLNNPLEHIDIETTTAFLGKTEKALENLANLQKEHPLKGHVKLLDFYYTCKKWRVVWLISTVGTIFEPWIKKNLYSTRPHLRLFDFYRLHLLIRKMK